MKEINISTRVSEPVRLARQSLWGEENRFLQVCRSLPGELVIAVLLYFLFQKLLTPAAGNIVINAVGMLLIQNGIASGETLMALLTPMLAWCEIVMMAGFILYMRLVERRSFSAMGFSHKKALGNYLLGLLCGFAVFSILVGLGVILTKGHINFSGRISPGAFLFAFGGYMIQGMAEEIEARSYVFLSISRKHREMTGILASGILFGAIHLNNAGASPIAIFNTVLIGFMFCLMLILTENIWFIGAFHSAWNLSQGNIYGIAVSGREAGPSVFTAVPGGGDVLLTGGAYGIEASVLTTAIVLIIIMATVFLIRSRHMEK